MVLGPQELGGPGEPARHRIAVGGEQVVVPAGRLHARAVTGGLGEPAVCPRHPGDVRAHLLRQPGEQRPVVRDGGHPLQRGDVEGAADHGDPAVPGAAGGADLLAHVRLAQAVPAGLGEALGAQGAHRLGDGGERRQRVGAGRAVLDHVLPPAFRVVVPGRLGEQRQRVGGRFGAVGVIGAGAVAVVGAGGVVRAGGVLRSGREAVPGGQVDEADRQVVLHGVPDRHPLRGELGVRPEGGLRRIVHGVGEQRDRRHQVLLGGQVDDAVGLRRALDQHRVRLPLRQGGGHRPGRAGAVVADAEEGDLSLGHAVTSRAAR